MSWLKNIQKFARNNSQLYLPIGLGCLLLGWLYWQFNPFSLGNDASGHEIYLRYIDGDDKEVQIMSKKSDGHGQMGRFIEMAKTLNGEMTLPEVEVEQITQELNRHSLMKYWLNCLALLNAKPTINPGFVERSVNTWAKFGAMCKFFALTLPPEPGNLYNNAIIVGQNNTNAGDVNNNAAQILAKRYSCAYDQAQAKRESMLGPHS